MQNEDRSGAELGDHTQTYTGESSMRNCSGVTAV
ncbi:MAG: hypothetical protein JWP07_4590, partial [Pseudonocardiales bacterium]|nr:hypothetical protein [Pseudonocardiales bacterium]